MDMDEFEEYLRSYRGSNQERFDQEEREFWLPIVDLLLPENAVDFIPGAEVQIAGFHSGKREMHRLIWNYDFSVGHIEHIFNSSNGIKDHNASTNCELYWTVFKEEL
jgi:hypothetical protein